jgi:hypothetical protein
MIKGMIELRATDPDDFDADRGISSRHRGTSRSRLTVLDTDRHPGPGYPASWHDLAETAHFGSRRHPHPDLDVLLLERAAHPGFWQSVTGSREGDEALLATACREVGRNRHPASRRVLSDWALTNTYEIFAEWRHRYAPGVSENTSTYSACACRHDATSPPAHTNIVPGNGCPGAKRPNAAFPGATATPF